MEGGTEVVLVAAFGRGNWLAAELAALGLQVSLVEVSEQLGRWTPDDWEGPFGYFHSEQLTPLQRERLIEEDYTEDIPEGFTLWLADGPIDFRSSLSPHLLAESGLTRDAYEFLGQFSTLNAEAIRQKREVFRRGGFQQNWLVHLAYQIASHVFKPNAEGVTYGRPLPLFSPWGIRRVSRKGFSHSLKWVESKGVSVYPNARLVDLAMTGSTVNSLEIRSAWSGALTADQFVWLLSGEETEVLAPQISARLYPKGVVKPMWNWVRYRLRIEQGIHMETLPLKFVMIRDLYAPWTHANLLVVQRTVQSQDLDVWIRIPTQHRFQRAYLEEQSRGMTQFISTKIPGANPVVVDMPQDHLYEYQELGPPRFPIYQDEDLHHLFRASLANMHYSSSEDWVLQEWGSVLKDQSVVVESIREWKKRRDAKRLKEAAAAP
ncbi:MAG: hypothetical protein IT288_14225 [Bdellovibrionales bacterium]|nr:hypothetical protein [Bdellovibrionales bacterium]